MDHLLYPDAPAVPPISVPFLCDGCVAYDGLGFCNYPQRQQWASTEEPLSWLSCEADELARRAQIWLYFGLLSEFLGGHVAPSSFQSPAGNLTTSALPDQLWRRRHAYLSTVVTWRRAEGRSSDKGALLLNEAARFSELLEQRLTDGTGTLALVSCSIKVLLEELGSTKECLQHHTAAARHAKPTTRSKMVSCNETRWKVLTPLAIQHQMSLGGWCHAQIHFLSQKYSCKALYYLSGLDGNSDAKHDKCTNRICTANTIDERSFRPKHTSNGCECPDVGSSSAGIASIIEEGRIPLVSSSLSAAGEPQLRITPAEHKTRYVAISHVWSGGLGNPQGNAIPSCQFARLMHLVQQSLYPPFTKLKARYSGKSQQQIYFWLDTLCIPVGKAYQSARQAAINMMAKIYSGATRVLVLDVHLQKIVFDELPLERALAHILSCSWMFRCWTLQEATLARSCYVQFADKAISMSTNSQSLQASKRGKRFSTNAYLTSTKSQLIRDLSRFLLDMEDVSWRRPGRATMWCYRSQEPHQAHAFAATWNGFLGRFTSKMEDLHLMIAGMQDYKVAPVRDLRVQDRMKAILKGHAMLPLALLFVPGSRLEFDNPQLQWAPAFPQSHDLDCDLGYMKVFSDCLLLVNDQSENTLDPPRARENSSHLMAATNVQLLRNALFGEEGQPQPVPYTCLIASSEAAFSDYLTLEVPNSSHTETLWIEACPLPEGFKMKLLAGTDSSMICILLPNLERYSHRADWYHIPGARFYVREQDDSSLHLVYDCPLKIYAYDRRKINATIRATDGPSVLEHASFKQIVASLVPSTHRIFIDSDISSWPTVPHFFTTDEEPFFTQATFSIYFSAWSTIHSIWLPFFIVLLAGASSTRFHMQGNRLPLLYVYIAKMVLSCGEYFWYASSVIRNMERIAWSEEFGSTANGNRDHDHQDGGQVSPTRLEYYELLNREPSLFIGPKRSVVMIAISAALLAFGFTANIEKRGVAQWAGIMVVIELCVRLMMYIAWLRLPGTVLGKWIQRKVIWRWWPPLRQKLRNLRRPQVKSEWELDRRPFQEGID